MYYNRKVFTIRTTTAKTKQCVYKNKVDPYVYPYSQGREGALDPGEVRAEVVSGGSSSVRRASGTAAPAGGGGGRPEAGGSSVSPRHQRRGQRDVRGRRWTYRAAPVLRNG